MKLFKFVSIAQVIRWAASARIQGPCSVLKICERDFWVEYSVSPSRPPVCLGALSLSERGLYRAEKGEGR